MTRFRPRQILAGLSSETAPSCKSESVAISASYSNLSTFRSAFLRVQLVDDALLIEFPDEAHVDESLGVGGFGTRVARVPTERGTTRLPLRCFPYTVNAAGHPPRVERDLLRSARIATEPRPGGTALSALIRLRSCI